jgi:hypothetical protein
VDHVRNPSARNVAPCVIAHVIQRIKSRPSGRIEWCDPGQSVQLEWLEPEQRKAERPEELVGSIQEAGFERRPQRRDAERCVPQQVLRLE